MLAAGFEGGRFTTPIAKQQPMHRPRACLCAAQNSQKHHPNAHALPAVLLKK